MIKRCLVAAALFATAALAVETPIGTPPLGPTSAGVNSISLVPVGDGFVGVWIEGSYCTQSLELRGIRFDRQLRPFQDRSFLIARLPSSSVILGTAPDGYAAYVAWDSGAVHVARIDADATVTVLSDAVPAVGYMAALRISREYLVFIATNGMVTLLDHSGAVVRSYVPLFSQAWSFDAAVIGDTLLITFISSDRSVHTASVQLADIAANRVAPAPVQSQPGNANGVQLATDGTHTMAFWFEGSAVREVRARPLNTAGNALSAGPLTLGSFLPQGLTAIAASDGYRVFFVENNQLVSLRVGFDGTLQSTTRSAPLTFGSYGMTFAQNGAATIAMRIEQHEAVVGAIAADGNLAPGTILSIGLPVQHVRRLLPFAGGAAALWTESALNDRLVVGRLSAAGKPLDGAGLRLRDSQLDQSGSAMATDGERLAVVWVEGSQLYSAIAGFPSASVRALANDVAPSSDAGISWNGTSYVISYRRTSDFAALRIDRLGNPIDPQPIVLMPVDATNIRPRLAFNGSDYLLLWERWYDPFVYIGEVPCPSYGPLPNELFAQRFSAALTPVGTGIPLATTTDYGDYKLDVQGDDISFGGGVWMISWVDRRSDVIVFTRVDANGQRLDPLDGRPLFFSCGAPFLAPAPGGWLIAAQSGCNAGGLWSVRVAADRSSTAPGFEALGGFFPGPATIEAFALLPQPMIAYRRVGSPLAYVDLLPQHPRAARH